MASFMRCSEPPAPKLSGKNKALADSLYVARQMALVAEIDSLCKASYEEQFKKAVDSVSAVRIKDIDKLLNQ